MKLRRLPQWTCAEWAEAIADYFFNDSMAQRPALLSMDGEAAAAIRGTDEEAAVKDLQRAVRARLKYPPDNPFDRVYTDYLDWRQDIRAVPPFLPLLAICVLAATRMEAADGVASTNYYWRLRELLDMNLVLQSVPGYDVTMPDLWRGLRDWLDTAHRGERGLSAIETEHDLVYIWPAISQAQLRRSDRQKFGVFYRSYGLSPEDEVNPEELFHYFEAWVQTSTLSLGAKRAMHRPEAREQLKRLLVADLKCWEQHEGLGSTAGDLYLALSLDYPIHLSLVAARRAAFPEVIGVRQAGTERTAQLHAPTSSWYAPLEWTPTGTELRETGLQLTGGGLRFTLHGAPVWPFKEDQELGQLVSCRMAPPAEPFTILVHESLRQEVRGFLNGAAQSGWGAAPARGNVPDGWWLFTGVTIDRPPAEEPREELRCLVPAPSARISLWGGLSLPRGSNSYLSGGEPDVWMPLGILDRRVQVDGKPLSVAAGEQRVPLSELNLPPGSHQIGAGPAIRNFQTLHTVGLIRAVPEQRVVHHLVRNGLHYEGGKTDRAAVGTLAPSGGIWIEGVLISGSPEDVPSTPQLPVRLPFGAAEYLVLGSSPGEIMQLKPKPAPLWVQRAGLSYTFQEEPVAFVPIWLFTRWPASAWKVQVLKVQPPGQASGSDPVKVKRWRDSFAIGFLPDAEADPVLAQLWDEYTDAAESL